jgi:predicted nucleic acid-binding protein
MESSGEVLCTTAQVLREYVSVVTRSTILSEPRSPAEAVSDARAFAKRFELLADHPGTLERWMDLVARYRLVGASVHDAHIAATALESGIDSVLTNNVAHFAVFGEIHTLPLVPGR